MENSIYNENAGFLREPKSLPYCLCRGRYYADLSDDFTLPDYMPCIRKLIKVTVTSMPPSRYLSGSTVKLSGTVSYGVHYVGEDGGIFYTELPSSYEITAPLSGESDYEMTKGAEIFSKISPESVVSRVNGERKLNIKCRLAADLRAFGGKRIGNSMGYEDHVQRLCKKAEYWTELSGENRDVEVVHEPGAMRNGERYVSSDCRVFVEQATSYDGYAECRGTVSINHLINNSDGETYVLSEKMPFSEIVEVDGLCKGDPVTAFGSCYEITSKGDNNDMSVEPFTVYAKICISVIGFCKNEMEYLSDAYSTVYESDLKDENHAISSLYACGNRNMTFSGEYEVDWGEETSIASCCACVYTDVVELNPQGRYVICGKCRFELILAKELEKTDGSSQIEYSAEEIVLPFKYECEEGGPIPAESYLNGDALSARARHNGHKVDLGCEISLSYCFIGEENVKSVCSMSFNDLIKKRNNGITVCYPDRSDSLWSVSKKYHARLDHTVEKNGITPESAIDDENSLHGVKYIIV